MYGWHIDPSWNESCAHVSFNILENDHSWIQDKATSMLNKNRNELIFL